MIRKDGLGITDYMGDGRVFTEQYFIEHLSCDRAKEFYMSISDKIIHVDTYPKLDPDADEIFDNSYWRIQFRIKKEDFGILAQRLTCWIDMVSFGCAFNEEDNTITVTTSESYKY